MKHIFRFLAIAAAPAVFLLAPLPAAAQQGLTWDQVKARFEAANPALKADALGVDEMKAEEITAFLRPNPQIGLSSDGLQIAPHTTNGLGTHWLPLTGTQLVPSINYLHEREHKRELRLQSAKEGTQIAASQHEDLERNLLFDLRSQFVETLEAKYILDLAKADLEYYDKIIEIAAAGSTPETSPKSISTASSCCAFNMRWRSKAQPSTCAPPRSSSCNCSTTARQWSSSM